MSGGGGNVNEAAGLIAGSGRKDDSEPARLGPLIWLLVVDDNRARLQMILPGEHLLCPGREVLQLYPMYILF